MLHLNSKKLIRKKILINLILIVPFFGFGQTKSNIGISLFGAYNKQGEYSSQFGNISYQHALKLFGTDLAINFYYKREIQKNVSVKIGIGYFKFGINKIINETGSGNSQYSSDSRPISYPTPVFPQYSTTKYHYNNLLFLLGIEKQIQLSRYTYFNAGLDYYHAYTFSQNYYIAGANTDYKTRVEQNFGDLFLFSVGVERQYKKVWVFPRLMLPIYKSYRQDLVFKEDPNKRISNWLGGIGIGLEFAYTL